VSPYVGRRYFVTFKDKTSSEVVFRSTVMYTNSTSLPNDLAAA
jgi:hypothetical protein